PFSHAPPDAPVKFLVHVGAASAPAPSSSAPAAATTTRTRASSRPLVLDLVLVVARPEVISVGTASPMVCVFLRPRSTRASPQTPAADLSANSARTAIPEPCQTTGREQVQNRLRVRGVPEASRDERSVTKR